MAEIKLQRIKSLYGEVTGILSQLPLTEKTSCYPPSIVKQYNGAVDELSTVTTTDYGRHKIGDEDRWEGRNDWYDSQIVRSKMGSIISRLEQEYGFGDAKGLVSPMVLTINQNQQVSISITPINEIINETTDEDIKRLLAELKNEVEITKNKSKIKDLLAKVLEKSWEVFIRVLPYILEKMGER